MVPVAEPTTKRVPIFAIGDSVTAGVGLSDWYKLVHNGYDMSEDCKGYDSQ